MNPWASLLSWTLPGRCRTSKNCPVWANGAKQVIVAARPFLLGVVADGGPFGMTAGGRDRAVEVEGQAGEAFALERAHHQGRRQVAHSFDARRAHVRQRAADGGHIRQAAQAQQPPHHGIVPVVVDVPQPSEAQEQMQDEPQHDEMRSKDRGALGGEALLQSRLQIQALEEQLNNNGSRKGGQLLVFEAKTRELVETGQNGALAAFHLRCPPEKGSMNCLGRHHQYPIFRGTASAYAAVPRRQKAPFLCNQRGKHGDRPSPGRRSS